MSYGFRRSLSCCIALLAVLGLISTPVLARAGSGGGAGSGSAPGGRSAASAVFPTNAFGDAANEPALARTCNGSLFIDYVSPPTPAYASDGDTVRVRLTLATGSINEGTLLTVDRVRFSLDCQSEAAFPSVCTDDGSVYSYPGDASANIQTSCATFWMSDNPGGGLQNELVFEATPNFDIPANTAPFCFIEFNLLVFRLADAADDVTPREVEQRAFYQTGDAFCDNGLGSEQTQSAAVAVCPLCDDGNQCNGLETCNPDTGECIPGIPLVCDDSLNCTTDSCDRIAGCRHAPVVCDDGSECTTDLCDPQTGVCFFTPIDCPPDQNFCTVDDCSPATGCTYLPLNCDDQNPCTSDSCNPATGCVYVPVVCQDGNECTTDACDPARGCTYTTITCLDGNLCTNDSCDPARGCVFDPVTCNDGNECTTDACDPATGCTHTTVVCYDANKCTNDACNPASGCTFTPVVCDDRSACTTDSCDPASGCRFDVIRCIDDNPCTDDSCSATTGCVYTPDNTNPCTDGNACTADACVAAQCVSTPVTCDDSNPCTDDTCNPTTGCLFTPDSTNTCTDGNACTTDACVAGRCTGTTIACNDNNPCTDDSCDSARGCVYTTDNTNSCDDSNRCTTDACVAGACVGTPITCNDDNPCTDDSCAPASGCVFTPDNTNSCDDSNRCTTDSCQAGRCVSAPVVCDDGNPCTDDACSPATGCEYVPDDRNTCSDGNACTLDACGDGKCFSRPLKCDDSNPCTDDSCDPATGCVNTPDNTNVCSDGNACTRDSCVAGQCTTSPVTCNDGNPCTDDSCDPARGCVYTPDNTNVCSDGNQCTMDACVAGRCATLPVTCSDNNPCTDDSCNPATGCVYAPDDTNSCNDGNACTDDVCRSGRCVGTPLKCDDGNVCTTDACDPARGCTHVCAPFPCHDGDLCWSDDTGTSSPAGHVTVSFDASGNVIVLYEQSRSLNDNSYGRNIVNWPRSHSFSDLVGSDKARFVFRDARGNVVFDFYMDYITRKTGTPSGYASLGVAGGEGGVNAGQASWLMDWDTSLAASLNRTGYCAGGSCVVGGVDLLLNSPPTSPPNTSYNVSPMYSQWNFTNSYTVKVSRSAFGANGFGSVVINDVHNSPPKKGRNQVFPDPCEPCGGGNGPCPTDGDQCAVVNSEPSGLVGHLSATVDAAGDVTVVYDQVAGSQRQQLRHEHRELAAGPQVQRPGGKRQGPVHLPRCGRTGGVRLLAGLHQSVGGGSVGLRQPGRGGRRRACELRAALVAPRVGHVSGCEPQRHRVLQRRELCRERSGPANELASDDSAERQLHRRAGLQPMELHEQLQGEDQPPGVRDVRLRESGDGLRAQLAAEAGLERCRSESVHAV